MLGENITGKTEENILHQDETLKGCNTIKYNAQSSL